MGGVGPVQRRRESRARRRPREERRQGLEGRGVERPREPGGGIGAATALARRHASPVRDAERYEATRDAWQRGHLVLRCRAATGARTPPRSPHDPEHGYRVLERWKPGVRAGEPG